MRSTCYTGAEQADGSKDRRHPVLRRVASKAYGVPGLKPAARRTARWLIQRTGLSLTNKQRIYNFFGPDTVPESAIACDVKTDGAQSLRLELDLSDELSRRWYFWGYGGYEPGTVRLYRTLLSSKSRVFDIGANIGFYALLAASAVEGRGEVHAFEPQPDVFRRLSLNARLNGFKGLRLNRAAISDTDGRERLFFPADGAWTNASLVEGFTRQTESTLVETMRLDTYSQKNGIERVDLVKLDVEGAEAKALRGMGRLLDEWTPDIICEVLEPYERELDALFRDGPYRKFLVTESGLEEKERIKADLRNRDYYLTVSPLYPDGRSGH